MALLITITDAGRAEIINAQNTGTEKITITAVALGTGQYSPSKTQTALQAEVKRVSSIAGAAVADDTIHVMAQDETSDAYNVGEFGLFSDKGTLIAVYSQLPAAGWIIQKAAPSTLLLATDIILESLDASVIEFGDISFINPPATTTTPGVVQLENILTSNSSARALTAAMGKKLQDEKAPLASPALTGNPTAPTQATGNSSTRLATTAFVQAAITALVNSSPAALDTLAELATALGNDANFATTMTNALAAKAPLASPALTGTPTAPTPAAGTNNAQIATAQFVQAAQAAVGLGVSVDTPFGGDLNAIMTSGIRAIAAPAVNNYFAASAMLLTMVRASSEIVQVLFSQQTQRVAFRTRYSTTAGVWNGWKEISTLNSPAFTGSPTAPTRGIAANDTGIANTEFVKAVALNAAYLATAVRGQTQGSTTQDPDTAVDPVILTNHANTPDGSGSLYWHITTTFYAAISATANRAQVAVSYQAAATQVWARSCYATVWTGWVRLDNLNSPAFTGIPTAPTAPLTVSNNQVATTAFVQAAVAALIDSSPAALNTLKELATALGNDPNFATTMTNALAGKLSLSGGTISGPVITSTRQAGVYGTYNPALIDHVWSMGSAYKIAADGSDFGNLYGLAYKHTNNASGGTMAGGHQLVLCSNGTPCAAIGFAGGFWTSGAYYGSGAGLVNIPQAGVAGLVAALAAKAALASPAFTGTPTVPTAATATNNTQAASTAFVKNVVAAIPTAPKNTASLGTSGWWRDGDTGLIKQWVPVTRGDLSSGHSVAANEFSITWPTTFPNGALYAQVSIKEATTGRGVGVVAGYYTLTTTGGTFYCEEWINWPQNVTVVIEVTGY